MSDEEYESPYCEVCGHCGEIGCCGIRNFISEHIEGKTNCKNEGLIINELIDLCDYKDEVFEKNKKLEFQLQEKENIIKEVREKVDNFDVFKEFTFPLMKRDEEQQVKSSIDYEWRKSIKEPILEILEKVEDK